jgi:hypothetical protein
MELRAAFLLIQVSQQGVLNDVLVTEAPLECEPPKPFILGFGQAKGQRFGTRLFPCGSGGRGRSGLGGSLGD